MAEHLNRDRLIQYILCEKEEELDEKNLKLLQFKLEDMDDELLCNYAGDMGIEKWDFMEPDDYPEEEQDREDDLWHETWERDNFGDN